MKCTVFRWSVFELISLPSLLKCVIHTNWEIGNIQIACFLSRDTQFWKVEMSLTHCSRHVWKKQALPICEHMPCIHIWNRLFALLTTTTLSFDTIGEWQHQQLKQDTELNIIYVSYMFEIYLKPIELNYVLQVQKMFQFFNSRFQSMQFTGYKKASFIFSALRSGILHDWTCWKV